MRKWQSSILAGILIWSIFCRAESPSDHALTISEYRTELDSLRVDAGELGASNAAPKSLENLPASWHVHTEHGDFEISTEGLGRDVRRYRTDSTSANASAIRTRIGSLRREIDGFEGAPPDFSAQRDALSAILARREFSDVHGTTWTDRLKRWIFEKVAWIFEKLYRALARLFGFSAIPNVGKYFVYGLIGAAGLALLYLVYRSIFRNPEFEEVIPTDLPVSAKEWTIWLAEARAAAARGDWRDAVHLAYWAGISFLEREGFWKPDRARTPREYLRLMSGQSEPRDTLTSLTRIFELAWYAKRDVSEQTFSETLTELEKLGCR
jgi:hypothetical protein